MNLEDNTAELIKRIRKYIYDSFIATSHAPVIEEIVEKFSISKQKALDILNELHEKHLIVLQPFTNRILMAHPFSNIPTSWVVKPNNKTVYYANCAWDAIAMHFTIHNSISIESFCIYCNNKINIRLEEGVFKEKIPASTLIGISKPASRWWENVIDTCANHMNFFCNDEHLKQWKIDNSLKDNQIGTFTDNTVIELSKFLYNNKIMLDYQRPTDEEERMKFKELNLIDDVWKI